MEINFLLDVDDMGFPKISMSASTDLGVVSITPDINSLIKIIPIDMLIQYKNIAKNKISDMIQNDQIIFAGAYVNHIDSINNYLNSLEEG